MPKRRWCVVCKRNITTDDIFALFDEYPDTFQQADALGMESLTENEQVLVEGQVHSECYENLE